jgi:hypothetical protein
MPTTRVEMPNGMIFRTNSARRYIVTVLLHGANPRWEISYRTDEEGRALAHWRARCRNGTTTHVIDTAAKAVIR